MCVYACTGSVVHFAFPQCGFIKTFATYRFMVDIGHSMLRNQGQQQAWDAMLFAFECVHILHPKIKKSAIAKSWTLLNRHRSFFKCIFIQINHTFHQPFFFDHSSTPEVAIVLAAIAEIRPAELPPFMGTLSHILLGWVLLVVTCPRTEPGQLPASSIAIMDHVLRSMGVIEQCQNFSAYFSRWVGCATSEESHLINEVCAFHMFCH